MHLLLCTDLGSCETQRTTVEMGNAALDKYESSGGLSWEERLIVRGFLDSNQDDTRLAVQKTVQGNHAEMLSVLPGVGLVGGKGGGVGPKGISIIIEPKIADQMGKRGWTVSSIQAVIDKPIKTVVTKDTRFDTVSGSRLNDPATGYIAKDGSYVVRNDRTGAIVQVSNKNDPKWVAPWD